LNEADDGLNDGNPGRVAYDYASGNNGVYTNALLGNTGTNQYNPVEDPSATAAQSSTTVGLTVECWVNWSTLSSCGIITKGLAGYGGNGGNDEFEMDSDYSVNANSMFPSFGVHTAANTYDHGDAEPIMTNTWYHLVGVCDESNNLTTIYVNGLPEGSFGMASRLGIGDANTYNLTIGAAASTVANETLGLNDWQTYAYVSDVAIFNYALSAAQVLNEYALGGQVAPSFVPVPQTTATASAGSTLTIPVTAIGTPPLGYSWTNITTGAAIGSGTTNASGTLNTSLNYPNVPLSWNGDELEVTVTNAYAPPAIAFVTLTVTPNTNSPDISFGTTNNQLTLSWPADHIGWQLQAQTNSVSTGISNDWVNVNSSATTNKIIVPVTLTSGCVFYRLVYP
jgi:hypothetical protein